MFDHRHSCMWTLCQCIVTECEVWHIAVCVFLVMDCFYIHQLNGVKLADNVSTVVSVCVH